MSVGPRLDPRLGGLAHQNVGNNRIHGILLIRFGCRYRYQPFVAGRFRGAIKWFRRNRPKKPAQETGPPLRGRYTAYGLGLNFPISQGVTRSYKPSPLAVTPQRPD